jgi:penicillin amidase
MGADSALKTGGLSPGFFVEKSSKGMMGKRRLWKKLILGFVIVFLVAVIAVVGYLAFLIQGSRAKINGSIAFDELIEPVEIIRDGFSIPHILAQNRKDLYFAQGFVEAQDRLWQMDLLRRISDGRLSEIFGKESIDTDRFSRIIGFKDLAERIFQNLDIQTRMELEAYAEGVNAYINRYSHSPPLEFHLLRYRPDLWMPHDSIKCAIPLLWSLSFNFNEEILYLKISNKLGEKSAASLLPVYPKEGLSTSEVLPTLRRGRVRFAVDFENIFSPVGAYMAHGASNAWVVGKEKSITNSPLLANDPHLSAAIPALWYEIHLITPATNVVGASIPGMPYVMIGHNGWISWGLTATMADTVDLFIEKVNPNNPEEYLFNGKWKKMGQKKDFIQVRGLKEPVEMKIRSTQNGPLVTEISEGLDLPISMHWAGYDEKRSLRGLSLLNRAHNWGEFLRALSHFDALCSTVVYADLEGNIGYQVTGKIPIRKKAVGRFPSPGWTKEYGWRGYIPFSKLPGEYNPKKQYIISANQRTKGNQYPFVISNSWAAPYRAQRIDFLLKRKSGFSIEDFQKIQKDAYSPLAEIFTKITATMSSDDQMVKWMLEKLDNWDHLLSKDSLAAALWEAAMVRLSENIFFDELEEVYPLFVGNFSWNYNALEEILTDPQSPWWDDVRTKEKETWKGILLKSLKEAGQTIEKTLGSDREDWRWGRLHQVFFRHPLGRRGYIGKMFGAGPFELEGGNNTINLGLFDFRRPFGVVAISSYRMIIDITDPSRSIAMGSVGQSGHPLSPHYQDMCLKWVKGEYHPIYYRRADIEKNREGKLILIPRE